MESNICPQHNLPYEAFCQKLDCQSKNRFACLKCATFGIHKLHPCVEIPELQQAIRDFQKPNSNTKSNPQEIEAYNKCITLITQQIKQIRIKIDQLLVDLEKALVGDINSKSPANQLNSIYQINTDNIFAVNDIDVQNLICQNVLAKSEPSEKTQQALNTQAIKEIEKILKSYSNLTEQYIQQMRSEKLLWQTKDNTQKYEFSLDQFQNHKVAQRDLGSLSCSLAEINRDQVLVAANAKQLNLVDLRTSEVVKAIDQENKTECGYVIKMNDNKAISCYLKPDCSLKVWNLQDYTLLKEMKGHTDNVIKLVKVNDHQVLSSSLDKTIILWDIDQYKLVYQFTGHTGRIFRALELMNDNVFLSGAEFDKTIRIWDISQRNCTRVLQHDESQSCFCLLKWDDAIFVSGGQGIIKKWRIDSDKPTMSQKLEQKQFIESMVKLNSRQFAIGFQNIGQISFIDYESLSLIRSITVGSGNGTIFQMILLSDNRLGVASSDSNVYVLK